MVTKAAANPTQVRAQHQLTLRQYATRVLRDGATLAPDEQEDQALCMREFLALTTSYGCTEKEVVWLIYAGLFR